MVWGNPRIDGAYPRASWKALKVVDPWNIFARNDALDTSVDAGAENLSRQSLFKIALNTPLFLSTMPFLCDDLAGLSHSRIP